MATAKEKLTAVADKVREISGSEGLLSLDAMTTHLSDANGEVSSQKALIQNIKDALEGKALDGEASPEYTYVPGIRFTGEQKVDTGIVCDQDTTLRIIFKRESAEAMYLYGVVNTGNTASVTAYLSASGGTWRFGSKGITQNIESSSDIVHTAVVSKTGIISANAENALSGVSTFETIGSLILGAARNADGSIGSAQFIGTVIRLTIEKSGAPVLDLAPVETKDEVYCFRDEVSGNYFDTLTDVPFERGEV